MEQEETQQAPAKEATGMSDDGRSLAKKYGVAEDPVVREGNMRAIEKWLEKEGRAACSEIAKHFKHSPSWANSYLTYGRDVEGRFDTIGNKKAFKEWYAASAKRALPVIEPLEDAGITLWQAKVDEETLRTLKVLRRLLDCRGLGEVIAYAATSLLDTHFTQEQKRLAEDMVEELDAHEAKLRAFQTRLSELMAK